ncbi:hypothetical protein KM043_002127 [Ampulex compressa]|nr:hypothetical protein KM043_002127 [Ampulex compressa]
MTPLEQRLSSKPLCWTRNRWPLTSFVASVGHTQRPSQRRIYPARIRLATHGAYAFAARSRSPTALRDDERVKRPVAKEPLGSAPDIRGTKACDLGRRPRGRELTSSPGETRRKKPPAGTEYAECVVFPRLFRQESSGGRVPFGILRLGSLAGAASQLYLRQVLASCFSGKVERPEVWLS